MNMKRKIGMLALVGTVAASTLGLSFASWKTDITVDGNVTANGKWDVKVTAAEMELSTGATAVLDYSNYQLNKVCTAINVSQVALQVGGNSTISKNKVGTHTGQALNTSKFVWLVDTTRFDTTQLGSLDTEARRQIMLAGLEDGSIIRLSDDNIAADGTIVKAIQSWYGYTGKLPIIEKTVAENIVDQLISESNAMLKQLRPDTYQNYALILCNSDGTTDQPQNQFIIAAMGSADGTTPSMVSYTDTDVTYVDVTFGLPGAWAEYTLVVSNNGTVNANLEDITFSLETEQTEQLDLDAPDLTNEVLKPGESCTLTFVVKVPDDYEGVELNASGKLNIKLPYSQDTVEEAPTAGHTHG